jgi:hypothetical protein
MMKPPYKEFEIIGLLFEHVEDKEAAIRQALALKKTFNIDYQLLMTGMSNKAMASKLLLELQHVISYIGLARHHKLLTQK